MNSHHPANLLARILVLVLPVSGFATEFHVAQKGSDSNRGTKSAPFRTIQRAAEVAQPGDVITVHEGIYRERVNPPRGGESDGKRIVYQAARGEKVEIRGSEVAKGWEKFQAGVWKVVLPNSMFGKFNPFNDLIRGDWFDRRGRDHHTGAVYLNGEWLAEAAKLEEVTNANTISEGVAGEYLLNVAWLRPAGRKRVPATAFAAQQGTQNAACSEGGECIGWVEHGDWVRYDNIDFGNGSRELEIRAASATEGGIIEVREDRVDGQVLGTCTVKNTGDWQAWSSFKVPLKPVSGTKTVCLVFRKAGAKSIQSPLWFAKVDANSTTVWAQFNEVNPNEQMVEVNVRQTVFYPDQPGRNFITVRGFALRHAATPWAPPTAEQVGLIGTHWSKGWVIENNVVSHSVCSGIALGKHGDHYDNTSANTAEGYVKTIERAYERGWTKENIGHHIVRNNVISHCEQAGVVGSLGAAFSTVTDNIIHDIHVRRLFSGAEMAGIKFHAAIDTLIARNHIYRTCRGLWLDWMAQGTRVSRNLFFENASEDLFVEVDHGPFLVDNNLFLSRVSLLDMSEGGAYAHNLFAGKLISRPEPGRETPYHPAHTTKMAGLTTIKGGDNRFINNIFVGNGAATGGKGSDAKDPQWVGGYGTWVYDFREYPSKVAGNAYLNGAQPSKAESYPFVRTASNPGIGITKVGGGFNLEFSLPSDWDQTQGELVNSDRLGKALVPGVGYEAPDGSPLTVDSDFFGEKRGGKPRPGPFEKAFGGTSLLPSPKAP
jgi:hypothetical protein